MAPAESRSIAPSARPRWANRRVALVAALSPDWFVAGGTIGLAVVTFLLVLQTRGSVRDANEQIKLERNRLEAAQWPRVFPAPSGEWISRQGPVQRSGLVERPTRQERRPGGCTERLRATRLHESGRTDGRAHPVKPRSRRSGGSPARMAATPPSALIAGGSGQAEGTVAAKLDTLSRKKR